MERCSDYGFIQFSFFFRKHQDAMRQIIDFVSVSRRSSKDPFEAQNIPTSRSTNSRFITSKYLNRREGGRSTMTSNSDARAEEDEIAWRSCNIQQLTIVIHTLYFYEAPYENRTFLRVSGFMTARTTILPLWLNCPNKSEFFQKFKSNRVAAIVLQDKQEISLHDFYEQVI